jgi:hypothetical protein
MPIGAAWRLNSRMGNSQRNSNPWVMDSTGAVRSNACLSDKYPHSLANQGRRRFPRLPLCRDTHSRELADPGWWMRMRRTRLLPIRPRSRRGMRRWSATGGTAPGLRPLRKAEFVGQPGTKLVGRSFPAAFHADGRGCALRGIGYRYAWHLSDQHSRRWSGETDERPRR